jgi:hypothetical protein
MKRIYDKSFRYTKAAETTPEYLRAKFRKIMREMDQSQPKVSGNPYFIAPLRKRS